MRAVAVLAVLRLVVADYTTETWTSSASDNIVGCFNSPGLADLDWSNWAAVPTGDGDVAGKCMSTYACNARTAKIRSSA